jgi:hypothetical protein
MFSLYCFHSMYICFQGACDKDLQMVQYYEGNNLSFSYVLVPLLKNWNTEHVKERYIELYY